ncbi:carboxypeptidase-like regulatory domain-containing protein [Falsiporphyromonas endometrii]|uniref:Carboxypeptidase-like regulatory domain-containing protein n=1 Tax=Falsiporphyromonas endometrii TaxID=1387297 RepID=A0ABV9K6U7_9PORP
MVKGNYFTFITTVLITILLSTNYTFAQNNQKITISGCVADKQDNKPVAFATVSISFIENNKEELYGQVTDQNGCFKIAVPLKSKYTIDANFVGKKFDKMTVSPQAGDKSIKLGTIYLRSCLNLIEKQSYIRH